LSALVVLFWFGLFHLLNFGLQSVLPADSLNGSVFYGPTWISLLLMALYLLTKVLLPSGDTVGNQSR